MVSSLFNVNIVISCMFETRRQLKNCIASMILKRVITCAFGMMIKRARSTWP